MTFFLTDKLETNLLGASRLLEQSQNIGHRVHIDIQFTCKSSPRASMVVCNEIWFWIRDFSLALHHSKLPKRPWSKEKHVIRLFWGKYTTIFSSWIQQLHLLSLNISIRFQRHKPFSNHLHSQGAILQCLQSHSHQLGCLSVPWSKKDGELRKGGGAQLKYFGI